MPRWGFSSSWSLRATGNAIQCNAFRVALLDVFKNDREKFIVIKKSVKDNAAIHCDSLGESARSSALWVRIAEASWWIIFLHEPVSMCNIVSDLKSRFWTFQSGLTLSTANG